MITNQHEEKTYRFIDLFAGLGGFHLALDKIHANCKCVFASELRKDLQVLYEKNFGMKCNGDINEIKTKDIPAHDILCAGFPCQPFSKAGKQEGFQDAQNRGNLFYKIMDILEFHRPEFIILENVPNLKTHDKGNTYKVIHDSLSTIYDIADDIISPHSFGIPHHRFRIYIVGRLKSLGGLGTFTFPSHSSKSTCNINTILRPKDKKYMSLSPITRRRLKVWQEFLDILSHNKISLPTFPIWAMEFQATYDFEDIAPRYQPDEQLKHKKGAFGVEIEGHSTDDFLLQLPIYAQSAPKPEGCQEFPEWKKKYIRLNRQFYTEHKEILDPWLSKIQHPGFENSHQKFEWNCGQEESPNLYKKIIQFRPSGIRVKQPTYSPALVLTTTQIPILPWIKVGDNETGRYMTIQEGANLQGMGELKEFPRTIAKAFQAFGNAVNVDVVEKIADNLLVKTTYNNE